LHSSASLCVKNDGSWYFMVKLEVQMFSSVAIWSRCFPVYAEVRRLLAEEAVGDVKLVKLGGGALLDIGVYCLQFVLMVFNGERPESIQATGVLLDSGVDESVVVTMKFSRKRMALCAFLIAARLPNDAVIAGTKGSIKVLGPMHCPTKLLVNDKETEYPLPEPCLPLNFTNSTGLHYETEEVSYVIKSTCMLCRHSEAEYSSC
uniref:Dihydrodiol dehydrogenase, tandem duplicate 1 n=1 Tax=Neolamprologus brichardi TaxID=32507 RepID=A0A3Q4H9K9_NEOBR